MKTMLFKQKITSSATWKLWCEEEVASGFTESWPEILKDFIPVNHQH